VWEEEVEVRFFCARVRVSRESVVFFSLRQRKSLRVLEMAGRYDSNPFDEEEEVNPFSVSESVQLKGALFLSPLSVRSVGILSGSAGYCNNRFLS